LEIFVTLEEKIQNLCQPTIESMGFDFWGCEYLAAGKHSTLRIYIDKPEGVTVDDCGLVSRQISAIMDVEDPISSAYMLEVSSPGVDRQLFRPEQYAPQKGRLLRVRTTSSIMGRRNFKGPLVEVTADHIEIEVDGEVFNIDFALIDKANLVIEF
jgi:ribosome maturation factor RimP